MVYSQSGKEFIISSTLIIKTIHTHHKKELIIMQRDKIFTKAMVVIILQYMNVSNQYVVHFKVM